MGKMIQLLAYPTGRPLWVDPDRVDAILDTLEMQPPKLAGGQPTLAIVGTSLIVGGATVNVAGHAEDVQREVSKHRFGAPSILN